MNIEEYTSVNHDDIVATAEDYNRVKRTGVYFLLNNDVVEYVGQTTNLYGRLWTHEKLKPYHKVSFIGVADPSLLNEVEVYYIQKYQPRLNIQGVTRVYKPSRRER